ncbi:uncharacterized protein LOC114188293 [Vigna unguiculata]|uniref:uncharacterized protein LOC114188293 n=1 Tax=Vigna unguiculata TaxID=3917 RepID=UPI001015CFCD|nr:uncharacterized protein LOC114188293 [Vigna unguiculata]
MTGAEGASSGNLVMGCCVISGKRLCVLYDSGATHSFVSESCVQELGLPVCELQFDLVVCTPASGSVRMSSLCVRCLVKVEEHMFKVNLICLSLQGSDVVLGMDWLSANRVLIDYREKRLLFSNLEEPELLSSQGHDLHTSRGGERGKNVSHTSGAQV